MQDFHHEFERLYHEFESLYWAELYWVELEEKNGRPAVGSLESAMVRFREDGLKGWKLDEISKTDLVELANEVGSRCV